MSILNVDKIQPIGGGSTITVDATDIQATTATITASKFVGSGDLDVDGHTNLDNVSVAGVTTFSGIADINSSLSVSGLSEFGNVSIAGVTTASGDLKIGTGITCHASSGIVTASEFATGPVSLINSNTGGRVKTTEGWLTLQGTLGTVIEHTDGTNHIKATHNGAAELYHAGNSKLVTSSSGISVTGVVNATSFTGGLPITNGADNRVITASSASAIQGESNLTFDGTQLVVQGGSGTQHMFRHSAGWGGVTSAGSAGGSGAGFSLANNYNGTLETKWSIYLDGSNDGLRFTANTPDQTSDERLRITSDGKVAIGFNAPAVAGLSIANSSTSLGFEFDTGSGFSGGPTIRGYYRPGSAYKSLGITGSDIKFGINDVEKARMDSTGRLLIGTTTHGYQAQVTIKNTNDFSTASISSNTDNIFLISDATSGNNVYGASIGFSRVQYPDRRAAAITTVQEGSDEDYLGLAFFTHDNADPTQPIVEKLRISPEGYVSIPNQPSCTLFEPHAIQINVANENVPIGYQHVEHNDGMTVSNGGSSDSTRANSRIQVPRAGRYLISSLMSGSLNSAAAVDANDGVIWYLRKNGSDVNTNYQGMWSWDTLGSTTGQEFDMNFCVVLQLAANDYLEVAYCNIHTNFNIDLNKGYFSVHMLS